jgi:hypothetical protein
MPLKSNMQKGIRALFLLALPVIPEKAQEAVQTVTELFRLIIQHTAPE